MVDQMVDVRVESYPDAVNGPRRADVAGRDDQLLLRDQLPVAMISCLSR